MPTSDSILKYLFLVSCSEGGPSPEISLCKPNHHGTTLINPFLPWQVRPLDPRAAIWAPRLIYLDPITLRDISDKFIQPAVESAVTKLLVAIKQLLESLTSWSNQKISEEDVSDVYVRLGNDFNATVSAFEAFNIDMSCVLHIYYSLTFT